MTCPLGQFDCVRPVRDLPEHGVTRDMLGTILEVFETPSPAYLVEFADDRGATIVMPVLHPDQVELVEKHRPVS